jgi:hypothetical protein
MSGNGGLVSTKRVTGRTGVAGVSRREVGGSIGPSECSLSGRGHQIELALTSLLLNFPQNRLELRTMSFDKLPKETLDQICEEVGNFEGEGTSFLAISSLFLAKPFLLQPPGSPFGASP